MRGPCKESEAPLKFLDYPPPGLSRGSKPSRISDKKINEEGTNYYVTIRIDFFLLLKFLGRIAHLTRAMSYPIKKGDINNVLLIPPSWVTAPAYFRLLIWLGLPLLWTNVPDQKAQELH